MKVRTGPQHVLRNVRQLVASADHQLSAAIAAHDDKRPLAARAAEEEALVDLVGAVAMLREDLERRAVVAP